MNDPKHKFVIRRPDDESVEITLDGQDVGSANHDEDGWAGMRTLEDTVRNIAKIIGATVEEE